MARNTNAAAAIVRGSYAVTPNRSVFTHRAATIAVSAPNASPTATGPIDSRSTIATTAAGRAPSAMRMPISDVRRVTKYASIP